MVFWLLYGISRTSAEPALQPGREVDLCLLLGSLLGLHKGDSCAIPWSAPTLSLGRLLQMQDHKLNPRRLGPGTGRAWPQKESQRGGVASDSVFRVTSFPGNRAPCEHCSFDSDVTAGAAWTGHPPGADKGGGVCDTRS